MLLEKEVSTQILCDHCGEVCVEESLVFEEKHFCCIGCKTVFEILSENNLCGYYDLNKNAGISLKSKNFEGKFDYLNKPEIEESLLDFRSKNINKATFYLPGVHCSSCVWLLENFHKIRNGVLYSRLQFLKKELSVSYDPEKVSLKEIVELLATLGYEPLISLQSAEKDNKKDVSESRKLLLQIAVTGFAMGNIMLLSFPEYFKLDLENNVDARYQAFFLYLNFALSMPVFFFGAIDYLKGAWRSIRDLVQHNSKILSVDIPIALGITALFVRSTYETLFLHSAGYWDSLAGLVFFLLVGKWVQMKTYDFLSFERNYKSFFPLAVKVKNGTSTDYKNVADIAKGDTMIIHNEELIPADSTLLSEHAHIDYSFVTGESEPESIWIGNQVFAGGRQKGRAIEVLVNKEVSQSYLTQLWNQDNYKKEKKVAHTQLADNFAKYFTYITLAIALVTGLYWYQHDVSVIWPAVTAVLMVACPCALTLSMPFTMGTVMGILGKNKFYVKNQEVIQLMNETDTLIFDKTGTLTNASKQEVVYLGNTLTDEENQILKAMTSSSVHPVSKAISNFLGNNPDEIGITIKEEKGQGISANHKNHLYQLGSDYFVNVPIDNRDNTARAWLAIDGEIKGFFQIKSGYRENWKQVLNTLKSRFGLFLLSGDKNTDASMLASEFEKTHLFFEQKPIDKLNFIKDLQEKGKRTIMIGDGINDAGALRQSDIGIALSEDSQSFTPASDAILDASVFEKLPLFLNFSKWALIIVKLSFLLSLVYNFIGVGWAVSGKLSPVMAAIFMPLSSISVVLFAVSFTYLVAWRKNLLKQM